MSHFIVTSQQTELTVDVKFQSFPGLLAISDQPFLLSHHSSYSNNHVFSITDNQNRIHIITGQYNPHDGESWITHMWNETNDLFKSQKIAMISNLRGLLQPFIWNEGIGLIYLNVTTSEFEFYQWNNPFEIYSISLPTPEILYPHPSFKIFPFEDHILLGVTEPVNRSIDDSGFLVHRYSIDETGIINSSHNIIDIQPSDYIMTDEMIYFNEIQHVDDEQGEIESSFNYVYSLDNTDTLEELVSFQGIKGAFSLLDQDILVIVTELDSKIIDVENKSVEMWEYPPTEEDKSTFPPVDRFYQNGNTFYIQAYNHKKYERLWVIEPMKREYQFMKQALWGDHKDGVGFARIGDKVLSGLTRPLDQSEMLDMKIINTDREWYSLWLIGEDIQLPVYCSPELVFETITTNDLPFPFGNIGLLIFTFVFYRKRLNSYIR
ncbi:MAG: hypothetical protein GPJ54_03030 [Candidatus Heimdallarchaeota archaeon]|nr:hypothetical protein [Candidatus Heimdallarchaeota archaeon]